MTIVKCSSFLALGLIVAPAIFDSSQTFAQPPLIEVTEHSIESPAKSPGEFFQWNGGAVNPGDTVEAEFLCYYGVQHDLPASIDAYDFNWEMKFFACSPPAPNPGPLASYSAAITAIGDPLAESSGEYANIEAGDDLVYTIKLKYKIPTSYANTGVMCAIALKMTPKELTSGNVWIDAGSESITDTNIMVFPVNQ